MLGLREHGSAPLSAINVYLTQNGQPLGPLDAGDDVIFDDRGRSLVRVDVPRLYNLVKNPTFGSFELRLAPDRTGFALYAFTFTSCIVPDSSQDGPGLLFNIP
jgi:hypothetical protein